MPRRRAKASANGNGNGNGNGRVNRNNDNAVAMATNTNDDRSDLKPRFEVGHEVVAAWWPMADLSKTPLPSPVPSPGVIKSYEDVENNYDNGSSAYYGPTRMYDVEFCDNKGELCGMGDHLVFDKGDFELMNPLKSKEWIGVRRVTDKKSKDKWASIVGWWVATIDEDGHKHEETFPNVSDALESYDSSVVMRKGGETKESDLNFPENWPDLFPHKEKPEEKFKVLIQFPDGDCGEVETAGSKTVSALKDAMEQLYGSSHVTKKMTFNGKELENDKLLSEYNIEKDSLLAAQMQIYVFFLTKKGFLLDVEPFATIVEVKAMIESKENDFSMFDQRIFLDGNNLENDMTLDQCGISDSANLFVMVRDNSFAPPKDGCIQIYVKCGEEIHALDVTPTDTIAVVKSSLSAKIHVQPDFQRLSFGGRDLENQSDTLWECGINSECLLYFVLRQEPESGNTEAHHSEHGIDLKQHEQSVQNDAQAEDDEDKITVYLINESNPDGVPCQMNRSSTSLSQVFNDYARKVKKPLSQLQFMYGEYGELPSECEVTAEILGITDGDIIIVNHVGSSYNMTPNGEAYEAPNPLLDLTGFSIKTGSSGTEDEVVVTFRGIGEDTRVKIDKKETTLQLAFGSFADRKDIDPASLLYVCGARRLSCEVDETASQYGIDDGDVIHATMKKNPNQFSPIPLQGKIVVYLLNIDQPESEKEFFRVDVNVRLDRVLNSYASRKGFDVTTLRFLYQGRILYADSDDDTTPAQLGIHEGDIVHVLVKKPQTPMSLTYNSIKTIQVLSPGRVFEPVVQVIELDTTNSKLTISDGNNTLSLPFHVRLNRLIDSGELSKFAIIWANDISIETFDHQRSKFLLLDADEAAPNPGKIIGSPIRMSQDSNSSGPTEIPSKSSEIGISNGVDQQKGQSRLEQGLPYLTICHNKGCGVVSDSLSQCSRCKYVGYCSRDCQSQNWKDKHKQECSYYKAYFDFIKEESDDMELADIFSFWTDLRDRAGRSKPLSRDVIAGICNSSLYCAFGLLQSNLQLAMTKAYILNAAFLRQCCNHTTPIEVMEDLYDIGIRGVALDRFLIRVPFLKAGHDALSTKASMLEYLKAKNANDERIVGSTVVDGEVLMRIKASSGDAKEGVYHSGMLHGMQVVLHTYARERGISFESIQFTFEREGSDSTSISLQGETTPNELGMTSRGEYTIYASIVDFKKRRAQKVIANFVTHWHRMRKVKKVVARNVIVDFVWRCHKRHEAKVIISHFIWHHHQQHKARKTIADLIWRAIALRRRQKMRNCTTIIQKVHRGHSTRKIYLSLVQRRLEEFRSFSAIWKDTIEQVPPSVQNLTGWALIREKIDVKKVELMDDDGNLADTDKKLNQALTVALNENSGTSDSEEEALEEEMNDLTIDGIDADAEANLPKIDWSQFQVTAHVVKFMKQGDAKYREIFVKKMKQLAKGERSHKLQKPLQGCKSVIYETYLENKSGFRILWTQEDETLVVWFVSKHKSVSRLAKLIDDSKNRTARQYLPDNLVSEFESDPSSTQVAAKREVLLDALGNVPLKLYDVNFDSIDKMVEKSWTPPMHLTEEEREVVEAKGTVLLLGRSGTGKTVCICNRIEFDRQRLGHKPNFTQLFVSRSSQLCMYVESGVGGYKGSSFTTFDKLVRHLESELSPLKLINGSFHSRNHVDFARFKQEFYVEMFPQEKISALIVWKAIRTFIKGSIEAKQASNGLLSREYFVGGKLGKNRCKVPSELRESIYDIFLQYQLWIKEQHVWDDCDRITSLLKGIEDAKKSHPSLYEEEIKRSKLYVDEVQDYTQIEILLFFYVGGGPGSLFLAGDPAQSVVEGTDFRFEEVRSVGYFVAGKERRHLIPEKPKIVNVNFRSHAGVLNCAGGFLDLLFDNFSGTRQLKKDFGLFKGARPGVFHNVQAQQLSTLLKEKLPGAVVITHDESASHWKQVLDHKLVYGIREAKGLEFKSVIILDFFSELPSSLQKPWRDLLLKRQRLDFAMQYPLVETHLKLVYTGVTRCIEQLFFAETTSSAAANAAVRWLTTIVDNKDQQVNSEAFATVNNVSDLESMTMTNDEFCVVGIDNAELASSPELELKQVLNYLDRAIYCFEKAQSSELVVKAQAHCRSILLREKLLQMASSSTENNDGDTIEEEAAEVLLLLLAENLLTESVNLLKAFTPLLSQYTQQKLEETITTKIQDTY